MQSPAPATQAAAAGAVGAAAAVTSPSPTAAPAPAAARSFSPARRGLRPSGTTGALWTLASPNNSSISSPAPAPTASNAAADRKLLTSPTRGHDWALVSAGSEAVIDRSRSRVAQAQPSIAAAADELLQSVLSSIEQKEAEQAEERRKHHAAPDAATLLAQQRVTSLHSKARRSAAARLERKLLRDLDVRHPTPLSALPQHTNVSVRPTAQAYAGKVDRMRNVLELQPSNFKAVHAHVQAHFVHGAAFDTEESGREERRGETGAASEGQREADGEEDEGKVSEPPLPVRSYAADQAQRKVAAHIRSASRTLNLNLFPPGSPKAVAAIMALTASATVAGGVAPISPTSSSRSKLSSRSHARSTSTTSLSPPSANDGAAATAATADSPAPSSSRAASPPTAASAAVPPIPAMLQSTAPLPPSSTPYNRFSTLRPSVVAEFKTFQREVAALPPRLNPNPLRDMWAAPSQERSSSKIDPQMIARQEKKKALAASRSQPILLSRELPPKQHTPRGLDFAYTPDAPDLMKALSGLPVPLPTAHPSMFAFEYAPPLAANPKGSTAYTPRGNHLTIESRGYSSSERVGLMVANYRKEQAQQAEHTAWLARFKQAYESEQRAKKTLAAKAIWAEAVAEQAAREAAAGVGPAVVHTAESSFRDESDRLEAAQKRKPQRVHLLAVPTGAAGAAAGAAAATLLASSSTSVLPNSRRASASPSPVRGTSAASSRRNSHRPAAISTTRSVGAAAADPKASPTGSAGDDTPSPTTPEGFYFTSKLNLQSYNKKQMERQLGLNPLAHTYDSDDDQWVHGVASSDDEAGSDEEAQRAKEQADAESKDRDRQMERMLREVMANSRAATAKAGADLMATAALPTRRPGKQLNVARFVMANPARRKAKLAQGEHGYARGNGFVSAQAEREKVEAQRKERESRHAENAARHQAAQIAEAERRKQERVAARLQAMQPGASVGLSGSASAAALTGPDAPLVYTGVEPSWLRARTDYKQEFLPRSQAFLAINSMEKPLAIRSAAERRNITAYLRTLPYLCEFDAQPQLQSELIALARLQPAKKGELIYKAGDTQTSMYILIAGSVRSITRAPDHSRGGTGSASSSGYSTRSNATNSSSRGANSIVTNRRRPLTPLAAPQSQRSSRFALTAADDDPPEPTTDSTIAVQNLLVAAACASPSPTNSPPLLEGATEEEHVTAAAVQRPDLPLLDTSATTADGQPPPQEAAIDGASGNLDPTLAAASAPGDGEEVDVEADMAAARLFAAEDPLGQMTPRSKSQRLHHLRHGSMGGTFLSKRAMQLSPGKRAWSAARSRAAKAAAAASDDHGLSDPTSTISLLHPGAVFGQSREAALLKEAEDAAARALDARLTPAARRWKRVADSIRVKKSLLRSFQKAAQEVEGMGAGRAAAPGAGPAGAASTPQQPSPGQAAADGSSPEVRRGGRREAPTASMLAARCRQETVVCASDDTVLIAISLADHDRIMQSSLDRKHHAQVMALKAMQIFQQPAAAAALEQERHKQQQLLKQKLAASASRRSSLKSLASLSSSLPLALSLSPWKIKHLVQLVPHLIPQRYAPGALIAEEDTLGHTLWLIVSGSIQVWKDVELLTYTRLPCGPNEPATVVETRKFRRIHVATRSKGDSIAEEAVCGAPKLDFTYKASGHVGGTHGGVELLAVPRHCFLPFFRPARLDVIKARVSTQRSAAVNFINRIATELLPGMRDQIGLGGAAMGEALLASAAAQEASDTPQHVINVNMLESLADDLRGDDLVKPNNRRRSRPLFATPQRSTDSPTQQQPLSPPAASVEQVRSGGPEWASISGTSPSHAAAGAASSPAPWVPPTPVPSAPYMRSASTPSLASPAAAPGLFSSPSAASIAGAVTAVSPVAALQPSPAEHRPHSRARFGSAIKVAARIVTTSSAGGPGGSGGKDKKSKGIDPATASGAPVIARRITFAEELSSGRDSSRSTSSSLGSTSARPPKSTPPLDLPASKSSRTTLSALELTPSMLNSGGLLLADADVAKLQQAAAAAAAAQAAAQAAQEAAAAAAATAGATPSKPSGADRRMTSPGRRGSLAPLQSSGGFSPMPESIPANASFASAVSMQSRPETRTISADKPGGKVDSTPKLSVSFAMFTM